MSEFKVGDRVRCIEGMVNSIPSVELIWGDIYTVKKLTFGAVVFVELEEKTSSYFATRFEMVEEETPLPPKFGELTMDDRVALFVAHQEGKVIQHYADYCQEWRDITYPMWSSIDSYRIKPEEAVPDSFDWSHATFNYVARDENGGPYGFEQEPKVGHTDWKCQGGYYYSMKAFTSYKKGNLPWDQSLICRPGFEVKNG